MKSFVRDCIFVAAIASLLFYSSLGDSHLWDRDEPRNAGCAAEMFASNDWVVPVFNAELRTHKPILLYWFIMSAYGMFGVTEFAARFWSATLALGSVLATYIMGRHLFGASIGRWSAVVLASSLMFDLAARAATPDSVLIFCGTAALCIYVVTALPGKSKNRYASVGESCSYYPTSIGTLVAIFSLLGLGVLAKGPVGCVLPMAVIGMFLLVMRLPTADTKRGPSNGIVGLITNIVAPFLPRHFLRTFWSMRPIMCSAIVLSVALPWYIWVGIRTDGQWLHEFFFVHNMSRAMSPMEGHDGNLLFYPVALLIGTFPWSVLVVPVTISTIRLIRGRTEHSVGSVFAVCWLGVYVGLFSIAQTKLPSYITPAYPAAALLVGRFIDRWHRGIEPAHRVLVRLAWSTMIVAGIALSVGLFVASREFLPGESVLAAVGLIPLVGGIVGLITWRNRRYVAAMALATTAVSLSFAIFAIGTVRIDGLQQYDRLVSAIHRQTDQATVMAYGRLEPSWVFYGGQPIEFFRKTEVDELLGRLENATCPMIIATESDWQELQGKLGERAHVVERVPYFLKDAKLCLIGVSATTQRMTSSVDEPMRRF